MRQFVMSVPMLILLCCSGCSDVGQTTSVPTDQPGQPGLPAAVPSFSWDAPVSNIDGTPVTDLAGYRIHFGTAPGVYTGSIDVTADKTQVAISDFTATVVPTQGVSYYLAVTAFDIDNNESAYSNEITKTFE